MHISEILSRQNRSSVALLFEETQFTYGQLDDNANRFANLFKAHGLGAGSRVSILLGNDPLLIAALFGAFKSGIIANPIHDRLSAGEVRHILKHAGSRLVVTNEHHAQTVTDALAEREDPPSVICFGNSGTLKAVAEREFHDQSPTFTDTQEVADDDGLLLLYTSGTTGLPKGVLLTHRNLMAGGETVVKRFAIKPTDRTLCVMPLSHTNGLMFSTIPFLMAGATVALVRRFSASQFWEQCRRYKANSSSLSPAILAILLEAYKGESLDGIKLDYIKVASAPTSVDLATRFENQFGSGLLIETYGLTETASVNIGNPVNGQRKLGSIGTAIPPHQAKIVDEQGNEVARGEVGEIIINSPCIMKGYFRDPEATAKILREGWIFSGDLARMDDQGYIFIVGRRKEIIIRGGENVSPLEIEQVVCRHPAVREAAAVGYPDDILGEAIGVCVVKWSDVSERELLEHCKAHLAPFKMPARIVFVDELPRNAIGKLVRNALLPHLELESNQDHP